MNIYIKWKAVMKVHLNQIYGEIIADNETYVLTDNRHLDHLTLSRTELKPGMSTRGHSHESQEEIYIFTHGEGTMIVGENQWDAHPGDTFLIPKGKFHRVVNKSAETPCCFTCIFESYDRSSTEAVYVK